MNKEIFIAVCDRLKTEVPGLRWIDAEEGQLNTESGLLWLSRAA